MPRRYRPSGEKQWRLHAGVRDFRADRVQIGPDQVDPSRDAFINHRVHRDGTRRTGCNGTISRRRCGVFGLASGNEKRLSMLRTLPYARGKSGPGSMPLEGNVYAHRIDKVRRLLLRLSSQEQFRRIGQAPGRLAFVSVLAIHNLKNSYGTGLAMNEDRTATQLVFAPAYRAFFWRATFFACALVYLLTSAEFEAARAVYEAY